MSRILLLVFLGGCASSLNVVQERAATALNCRAVEARELGAGTFEARGCGQTALFRCSRVAGCDRVDAPAVTVGPADPQFEFRQISMSAPGGALPTEHIPKALPINPPDPASE
jgi:hypothetical protein